MGKASRNISLEFQKVEQFADSNQWIRYPVFLQDLMESDDQQQYLQSCPEGEEKTLGILHDYLRMWTKVTEELLEKLRETNPGEGMIGEVYYWRDLTRILEGISGEVKQP